MKIRKVITVVALFILVTLTGRLWITTDVVNRAPNIIFNTIDGRQFDLNSLRGKPVLVTFWATSCTGCMKEMPHLISLYNDLSPRLEIIGVAMAYDPPSQVVKLTEIKQVPYPISLDVDGKIADAFGNVMSTPTSFLIAPNGKIIKHKIGGMDMDKLQTQILDLLVKHNLAFTNIPADENS